MKVIVDIADHITEDRVTIEAAHYHPQVAQLVEFIHQLDKKDSRLKGKQGDQIYLIDLADIYRLVIEDKVLHIKTAKDDYISPYRLYQVKEGLSSDFLQISQSEIIHIPKLDHLQVTPNGLVKLILKNGDVTYSSRRYLSLIKEALGL